MAIAKGIVERMEPNDKNTALFVNVRCDVEDKDDPGFYNSDTYRITVFDDYRDDVERSCTVGGNATLKFDPKSNICTGGKFKKPSKPKKGPKV